MDLVGRCLLAVLFVAGAMQKVTDPSVVIRLLEGVGLPGFFVWPAAAFNAAGAVALALGWRRRTMGLVLAAYCAVTSLLHWIPADPWQMSIVVKNWAIAGGLLVYAGSRSG
jgi:putative oxidoreductase